MHTFPLFLELSTASDNAADRKRKVCWAVTLGALAVRSNADNECGSLVFEMILTCRRLAPENIYIAVTLSIYPGAKADHPNGMIARPKNETIVSNMSPRRLLSAGCLIYGNPGMCAVAACYCTAIKSPFLQSENVTLRRFSLQR